MHRFCEDYDELGLLYTLPEQSTFDLYRHILLNKQSDVLYCFAPKTGCTNLKVLLFVSEGLLPISVLRKSRDDVNQDRLESLMGSFFSMDNESRIEILKSSYKFTMWRNPLERLASIYRSKVQRFPLVGFEYDSPHYNFIRKAIYRYTHQHEYEAWESNGGLTPVNISFGDFIDYWAIGPQEMAEDEHFQSILHMCQPCRVRYDFYGNFKNFMEDAQVLVERLGGIPAYLRQGYYDNESSTGHIMLLYYRQLDYQQKKVVLHKLSKELDFYYRLFPEERDSHKSILQTEDELPLTFR